MLWRPTDLDSYPSSYHLHRGVTLGRLLNLLEVPFSD